MSKLGFIGLGIMGAPMAAHLIKAGHEVFLSTRSKVPAELLVGKAQTCASASEVAQKADIIFMMLPDTPDVAKVLFGDDGVAQGLSQSKTVVDMSSISPMDTKAFAQKINALGCDYLDAPVSGGEVGAKAASLTIMVGGPEATFEKVKPLFELMGKNITLVGGNGDGQTCKVANQIIVALNRGGGRSAAVRRQGRCRPGARAPSLDGWLRFVEDSRGARRAHGQAHLRSGLSHRAASKRPESGLGDR